MTWARASLRATLVVGYFVVMTVWLPSSLLSLNAVASAPIALADLVAVASWSIFLVGGIWGLRWGQRRGWL